MLTQEALKELFDYNSDTGVFVRLKTTSGRGKKGAIAGCVGNRGYSRIMIDGTLYQAHRLAWLYVYGEFPGDQIDHINHDRADNRMVNLRPVSNKENCRNSKLRKSNKSGVHGVCWYKQTSRWHARIDGERKNQHLGFFKSLFDAVCARKSAEILYGYHENHGA